MITPAMIACGKRYVEMLPISVGSFLRHHDCMLHVIADDDGKHALKQFESKNLLVADIVSPTAVAKSMVKHRDFLTIDCYNDGKHDRTYSALKPVIINEVVKQHAPGTKYVLSLDVDTLFTGDIITRALKYLDSVNHKFDLYLVERIDPRMSRTGAKTPGSGFTLWRNKGPFIKSFIGSFRHTCVGKAGGSQDLINDLFGHLSSNSIPDPLLHFVSPDLVKPNPLSDKQILKLKPAYIHLHGAKSFERLKKFNKLFHGE